MLVLGCFVLILVATQKEDRNDLSSMYVRYSALRFMFIDDFSTIRIDILAERNDKTSRHIRERVTWSRRKREDKRDESGKSKRNNDDKRDESEKRPFESEKRPFGELNVFISGDE